MAARPPAVSTMAASTLVVAVAAAVLLWCTLRWSPAAIVRLEPVARADPPRPTASAAAPPPRPPRRAFFGELCSERGLEAMLAAQAPSGTLVLLVSEGMGVEQLIWATNTLGELRAAGVHDYILVRESEASCAALSGAYASRPLVARALFGDGAPGASSLACGWYAPSTLRALQLKPSARLNDLWLLRWHLAERVLARGGVSVLMLDLDVHLAASPLPFLHARALAPFSLLYERDGGLPGLNCGCVFMRAGPAGGGVHRLVRGVWELVRAVHAGARTARGQPLGTMDQDVMNDELIHSVLNASHPFNTLSGRARKFMTRADERALADALKGRYQSVRPATAAEGAELRGLMGASGARGSTAARLEAWLNRTRDGKPARALPLLRADAGAPRQRALPAPGWLFEQLKTATAGPPVVGHLVTVPDKGLLMRASGWWRHETDEVLGILAPPRAGREAAPNRTAGGALAAGAAGAGVSSAGAGVRLALALGAEAWHLDDATRAGAASARARADPTLAHARAVRAVSRLALAAGALPVWPPLAPRMSAALRTLHRRLRETLVGRIAPCPPTPTKFGRGPGKRVRPRPPPPAGVFACAAPIEPPLEQPPAAPRARDSAPRAVEGGGGAADDPPPPECYLLPPPPDPEAQRVPPFPPGGAPILARAAGPRALLDAPCGCYTAGGALLEVDVRRHAAAGRVVERALELPRALWASGTELDARALERWAGRHAREAGSSVPTGTTLLVLRVRPPRALIHASEHGGGEGSRAPRPAVPGLRNATALGAYSARLAWHDGVCGAFALGDEPQGDGPAAAGVESLCYLPP